MDRFHKICFYRMQGRLTDIHGPGGERVTRKQTTSRPDNVWPDMWEHMSDASKKKAKQKWAIEKPKLDNARQLRGIFFIELDDEELKHALKNARRKLEIPMPAAIPCRTPLNCRGETCRSIGEHKTEYSCIVDADESMRIRLEGVPHGYHEDHIAAKGIHENTIGRVPQRYHEDHITAKGVNSLSHYNLVRKFIPMPQALKNTGSEGSGGKRMEKCGKIPAWQLTKVRNKKAVIDEARAKGSKVHFASLMDLCHLKNSELEPQFQKCKGRAVLRGDIVKMIQDHTQYLLNKDHQHHK